MSDYTPTTDEVRDAYGWKATYAGFDRWLTEHDRQVKAEAWEQGEEAGMVNMDAQWGEVWDWEPIRNPHRSEQ